MRICLIHLMQNKEYFYYLTPKNFPAVLNGSCSLCKVTPTGTISTHKALCCFSPRTESFIHTHEQQSQQCQHSWTFGRSINNGRQGEQKTCGFVHEFLNKLERKSMVSDHKTSGMDVSASVFYASEPFYFSDTKIGKGWIILMHDLYC